VDVSWPPLAEVLMTNILTQHNNRARTGVNADETILTIDNVPAHMGLLTSVAVDSQILAQPLFVSQVQGLWPDNTSVIRDLLIVATMHGTIYAFDASRDCAPVWASWLPTYSGIYLGESVKDIGYDSGTPDDKDYYRTNPEWGVLSTPVVDAERQCVYAVMWHNANGGTYRLHALNVLNGMPALNSVVIVGSMLGEPFSPPIHKQRPGLLLLTPADLPADRIGDIGPLGTVYIAFGASIVLDLSGTYPAGTDYHGWVFAYDVERDGFSQRAVWCSSPNNREGGIWQSGSGLTADDEGNIYCMTADGPFSAGAGAYGDSLVKLACSDLRLLDYFTPFNWLDLDAKDLDLGSSGPLHIPGTGFVVGAGKQGMLYCVDRNQMGGFTPGANAIVSEIQATPQTSIGENHVHGTPVYVHGAGWSRLFVWGEEDVLRAVDLDRVTGQWSAMAVAAGAIPAPSGMPGGMLSLSCNPLGGDAILWALLPLADGNAPTDANKNKDVWGVLRAFAASETPILREIWNSENAPRFRFAKFVPPTIANGRVYVVTYDGRVFVFGLR
jgi:hypothetical protein